jgi:hypothetical protein
LKLNRVAQLAFVVVNIALCRAHVLVPRQRLYHPNINALAQQQLGTVQEIQNTFIEFQQHLYQEAAG